MSEIDAAARAAGLQRDWEDADGRAHRVDAAVVRAVLDRLDTRAAATPFLPAVAGVATTLPEATDATRAELELEDGTTRPLMLERGRVPGITEIGYHRLRVDGRTYDLAVAPPRCPPIAARGWGASVQIPALRTERPSPYGDYAALADAAARFGVAGSDALAISPTHALFPADPDRFSPYAPSTRLFHNGWLADAGAIGATLPLSPGDALIDWPAAVPVRLAQLRAAFDAAGDGVRDAVAAFRTERGGTLEAHARFDALHQHLGGSGWRDWPVAFHDPASAAVERFAANRAEDVAFHAFLQWLADRNLADAQRAARGTMRIGLIADMAVGMAADGSHGWSARAELLDGLTVGAPPDPLGPDGQNWGITALDPFALARTGFAPFIATLRTALAHAGGLRVDHALGLDRLWVIPEGGTAGDGIYLTMPGAAMKAILAIEAHRAGAVVIAEDLGTVPPGFRDDLARRGMYGMRVLPFERDADGGFTDPAGWDRQAVAMTGTHDTPTIAGWWSGRDIDWSARLGRTTTPEDRTRRGEERAALWATIGGGGPVPDAAPVDAILHHVAAAPCPLLLVPVEDLASLEEQPNLPGTTTEHPNWRRRLPEPSAALLDEPAVARRTALLSQERPR